MTHDQTLDATANIDLGNAGEGGPAAWVVQFIGSGWTGSIQPQGRVTVRDPTTGGAHQNIAFIDAATGAVTTTAPTATGMIEIPASGIDVRLVVTVSAGTVRVIARPVAQYGGR